MPSMQRSLAGAGLALLLAAPTPSYAAENFNYQFYGSARLQGEAVRPENREAFGSYTALRDAYSRLGVTADYTPAASGLTIFGQLEVPVDLANLRVQDPFDHSQDVRVAQVGLRGNWGSLAGGKMWMPYYNAIAYPVDVFSSYYTGFATFTNFRLSETLSYYSPEFNGFSFALAWSNDNGAGGSDRYQGTATYDLGAMALAAGLDRLSSDWRIWGFSLTHNWEKFYLGAKLEIHDSDISTGYGADGDIALNLFTSYTMGRNTLKGMLAQVDNFGETIIHLGVDHQFNPALMFFVEYYREQERAAITTKRGSGDETWLKDFGGGQVLVIGARFDF